jgi:hypothetical protein
MYVFSIDIPFKGSQSLAKISSKVTAVSYLHSGVNDSAVHGLVFAEKIGVNDYAVYVTVTKVGDYKVDLLR